MIKMFYYADIPEDAIIKPFMPIMPIIWQFYQENGWEMTQKFLEECEDCAYYFFEDRLNESIKTAQYVFKGKFSDPDKVLSYVIVVPPITIRADLIQGTVKLLGGESFDVTWVAMNDLTQEIFIFLNAHCEDGIPVDWWIVRSDDEILDRRHMKYGWKIREIPQKTKDLKTTALRVLDVLRDIRNERTPQWATAQYIVAPVWVSFAVDLFLEISNFETLATMWEGRFAHQNYGLPDSLFAIHPFPSILNAMFLSGKHGFMSRAAHLVSEGHLYFQPIEERTYDRFANNLPEINRMMEKMVMETGLPYPIQSLNSTLPNVKKKDNPDIRFQAKYPDGDFIKMKDSELDWDDVRIGTYFDITTDTSPGEKLDPSRILSRGIGSKTIFS